MRTPTQAIPQANGARCTLVFARHIGRRPQEQKPTAFTAGKLLPLAEEALKANARIHVIHERIPDFAINNFIIQNFELFLKDAKIVRELKSILREERMDFAKKAAMANRGEESDEINKGRDEMYSVILSINSIRPSTILNHLNFYAFEAVVENSWVFVHEARGNMALAAGNIRSALGELVKANEAMARSSIMRDREVVRQAGNLLEQSIGDSVFIPRGTNHTYMVRFFEENGIPASVEIEPDVPDFNSEAIRRMVEGSVPQEELERLALLDTILKGILSKSPEWGGPEVMEEARAMALANYESVRERFLGSS